MPKENQYGRADYNQLSGLLKYIFWFTPGILCNDRWSLWYTETEVHLQHRSDAEDPAWATKTAVFVSTPRTSLPPEKLNPVHQRAAASPVGLWWKSRTILGEILDTETNTFQHLTRLALEAKLALSWWCPCKAQKKCGLLWLQPYHEERAE